MNDDLLYDWNLKGHKVSPAMRKVDLHDETLRDGIQCPSVHDPKIDDPAIREALGSEVFYLGCLGSKRTHAKRVERLAAAGYSDDAIARIHAPVGLAIGARSPAEIAISVLAEITRVLRQGA